MKKQSRLLGGLRDLLPLGGIVVPVADKSQVVAVLERQLGEWPNSHIAPDGIQDSVSTQVSPRKGTVRVYAIFASFVVLIVINTLSIYNFGRRGQTVLPPFNQWQPTTSPQAEQFGRIALNAISGFHDDFSDERYDSACRFADPQAMRGITGLPCKEFLAWVHTKLGKVEKSEQVIRAVGPVGAEMNVVIDSRTRFEHGTATEHFEWRLSTGQTTLKWYRIESSELSK
jgi:hypothetical protein